MKPLKYGVQAKITHRWWYRYNAGYTSRYPCRLKGCINKLRNGRCGLDMTRLEIDESRKLTGRCLDMSLPTKKA